MGIDCYYNPLSNPSRAVLLAAKNIGVPMNLKLVDIFAGDHLQPEFAKMNPLRQIPVIDQDGFYMYESRAIVQYLGNSFAKDESLYPKEPRRRFLVDQRLMFDYGELYRAFADAYYPVAFHGQTRVEREKLKKLDASLHHTNGYLEKSRYIAGENLTIADFCMAATLSTIEASGHDIRSKYPAIGRYQEVCSSEIRGYAELNQQGADQFGQFIKQAMARVPGKS